MSDQQPPPKSPGMRMSDLIRATPPRRARRQALDNLRRGWDQTTNEENDRG